MNDERFTSGWWVLPLLVVAMLMVGICGGALSRLVGAWL